MDLFIFTQRREYDIKVLLVHDIGQTVDAAAESIGLTVGKWTMYRVPASGGKSITIARI